MKRTQVIKALIGLVAVAVLLGSAVLRVPVAADSATTFNLRSAQAAGAPLTGAYTGQVTLEGVYSGVFSDTLPSNPFEGGYIDLAFDLEQVGVQVDGYISLEHTQVFTQEHTLNGQAVGPWVSGAFDGIGLTLVSEKFTWQVAEGRALPEDGRILPGRLASRQFRLVTTDITNGGAHLAGEYRETFWGLSPRPITLLGTFSLTRPVYKTTYKVYLPELFK